MNRNKAKELVKTEMMNMLMEDINYNFNFKGKKMTLRFDVNSNPTKKGIKIQFTPIDNLATNPQVARQFVNELQIHLNQKLGSIGMNADFDPDVPYQNVIGFTLKLGTISNMIVKALGANDPQTPEQDEKSKNKLN